MSQVTTIQEKTSPKLAFCFSMGEVASNISWYMVNSYLTLFYSDVVGLSATAISLIMLIARVWDAINDPIMGAIVDHTNTRWGKFRPYLMFAPPVLAIFNLLTFTVMPVKGTLKVVLCLLFYIGTGMAYTVCNMAYNAMVNVIAKDSQVRMNLITAKGIGSSIIGIVLGAVVMPMILAFGHSDVANAKGFFWTALIMSVAIIPCFWITAGGCKETYLNELHANDVGQPEKVGFWAGFKQVVMNRPLLMTVLSTLFGAICVTGRMGLLSFYIIYVVGNYTQIALVYTVMTVTQLVGTLVIPWGTKKYGKRNWLFGLQLIMNIAFIALYVYPQGGMGFVIVLSAVCGLCNSAATIAPGMIADSLEYGDWKYGVRMEGVAYSFLSLSAKLATAICGAVGILLLSKAGYVPNQEQTEAAKQGINFVVNIIPAIIGFFSLVPLFFYNLSNKKVAEIRADLDAGIRAQK